MHPSAAVREFHQVYDAPIGDTDKPSVDFDRVHFRLGFVAEEFAELVDAVYGETAGTLVRQVWEHAARHHDDDTRDTVGTADALADLIYVIYGFALEAGIDLDEVVREVHRSNLSKLGADGNPILREDGKVLKGPNFFPPDIAGVLGLRRDEAVA